jgi:hypothetical protein
VALTTGTRVTVVSFAMLQQVKLDVRSMKCDTVVTFEARAAAPATLRAGARVTVVTFEGSSAKSPGVFAQKLVA